MIVFNGLIFLGIVALVVFGVLYAVQKRGGVNSLNKYSFIGLGTILAVYIGAPYLYQKCEEEYQDFIWLVLKDELTLTIIYGLFALFLLVSWVKGSLLSKSKSVVNKIVSFIALGLVIAFTYVLYSLLVLNPHSGVGGGVAHIASGLDRRRNGDMRQMQIALELHRDEHGSYPKVLDELIPDNLEKVLTDPITKAPYEYGVSDSGDDYVIKTNFGVRNQTCRDEHYLSKYSIFNDDYFRRGDLDGTIYGVECDDPAYCVSSPN